MTVLCFYVRNDDEKLHLEKVIRAKGIIRAYPINIWDDPFIETPAAQTANNLHQGWNNVLRVLSAIQTPFDKVAAMTSEELGQCALRAAHAP